MSQKINTDNINYLAFEGGGGKGIVYLGVVQALEEKYMQKNFAGIDNSKAEYPGLYADFKGQGSLPLFPIWSSHPKHRPLKGVSGSSAGAITAFLLAMGLSSQDIEAELKKTDTEKIAGKSTTISKTENFFEHPDILGYRTTFGKRDYSNLDEGDQTLRKIGRVASPIISRIRKVKQYFINLANSHDTLMKRLLLSDYIGGNTVVSPPNNPLIPGYHYVKPYNKATIEAFSLDTVMAYIYSLLFHRGIFTGFEIRKYFEDLMERYLMEKIRNLVSSAGGTPQIIIDLQSDRYFPSKPGEVTFKWFYEATGVDLVITGVNVTQEIPLYFSLTHTPDFPVIEAVAISMNIPILFKPVYIDTPVDKSYAENDNPNMKYYGLYVDGGATNNLPIHAFNNLETSNVGYRGDTINIDVVVPSDYPGEFKKNTIGFELGQRVSGIKAECGFGDLKYTDKKVMEKAIFKKNNSGVMGEYMGELLNSLMYHSTRGQVNSPEVEEHVIVVETGEISTLDFSSPELNGIRGEKDIKDEKELRIRLALELIDELLK